MNNNKPNKELTDQLKNDLKEAKTKEELDTLVSSAGLELSDDQIGEVTGGIRHRPNPATCDDYCLELELKINGYIP